MINLDELIEEHGVVGAQVAVLHNGEITDMAAGVLNNVTGEKVTPDAIFQIGSITKVWTATLVQQLVNEGLLDLDRPVRDVLPEFALADEQAARVITPRHLLTHTAGFQGDLFHDTGNGDDMLEKYVVLLADARQEAPPGELYTYCNSGFTLLGRVIEVLRGKPFRAVVRERLIDELGLCTAVASHAEYATQIVATGHVGKEPEPAGKFMAEGDAPAGTALAMSARDLLEFVRMHLGTSEFDAMRESQVVPPNFAHGGSQGLGWAVHEYADGVTGIGHTGSTLGYRAYLRVIPAAGLAIAVLTNGGESLALARAVFEEALGREDIALPGLPTPPPLPVPVDVERVVGVYRSTGLELHVTEGDGGRVKLRYVRLDPGWESFVDGDEHEFTGLREDALIAVDSETGYHQVVVLCGRDEQDRVKYLHWGRAAQRV
ncbi:serine hydrolase [Streptomyces sp. ID05-26A]|nr:serine hydrolase [Streptomyces sp. ID05-26A]